MISGTIIAGTITDLFSERQASAVSFEKTPSGTRGARGPGRSNAFSRFVTRMMIKLHRRSGDKFMGLNLLYLTTVGAKTGQERLTPVAYFPDGDGWLVVASSAGAIRNPSWYHNMAAHPDQIWIEVGGRRFRVTAEQLDGPRREAVWQRITSEQPRYAGYQQKTDRVLPIIRLTPVEVGSK
jgi:deazaflavin-dependent oxidoreductase (nitroreductase family)